MAKIITITIGLTESVNVAPYEYIKPSVQLTAEVEQGETYDEVFDGLKVELKNRMDQMVEHVRADYGL